MDTTDIFLLDFNWFQLVSLFCLGFGFTLLSLLRRFVLVVCFLRNNLMVDGWGQGEDTKGFVGGK